MMQKILYGWSIPAAIFPDSTLIWAARDLKLIQSLERRKSAFGKCRRFIAQWGGGAVSRNERK